ncbi:MAG: hypothetical protein E6G92_13605 [Alphaproteobacteria bacterium]|nr:MAG: hypothetical protein E6G92_13605 [Alphaproteobacteria bacterium]
MADAAKKAAQAVADAAAKAAQAIADAAAKAAEAAAAAAEAAAQAVADAANAAANAVGDAIESAGNAIGDAADAIANIPFIGPAFGAFAGAVSAVFTFVATVVKSTINIVGGIVAGAIRIVGGLLTGRWGMIREGIGNIVNGILGGVVAVLGTFVAVVQTGFRLQRRDRALTGDERDYLWRVYRGSISFALVRIIEGKAGLFSLSDRPFTLGNRIYTKDSDLAPQWGVLVHECCHVWQNQHEGTAYIGAALLVPTLSYDAYSWWIEQPDRAWRDFNKEAQAQFIEDVFRKDKDALGNNLPVGAFFADDPLGSQIQFHWDKLGDLTDYARTSVAYMRAA